MPTKRASPQTKRTIVELRKLGAMRETLEQIAARLYNDLGLADVCDLRDEPALVDAIVDALRAAQATGSAETLEQLAIARARLDTMTRERDNWTETAAFHLRNEDFYRGLVHQTGKLLGPEVYVSDDGSVLESVLALKVPELVKKLVEGRAEAEARIAKLAAEHRHTKHLLRQILDAAGITTESLHGDVSDKAIVAAVRGSAEGRAACAPGDVWILEHQILPNIYGLKHAALRRVLDALSPPAGAPDTPEDASSAPPQGDRGQT
jgi:hypothetical protein